MRPSLPYSHPPPTRSVHPATSLQGGDGGGECYLFDRPSTRLGTVCAAATALLKPKKTNGGQTNCDGGSQSGAGGAREDAAAEEKEAVSSAPPLQAPMSAWLQKLQKLQFAPKDQRSIRLRRQICANQWHKQNTIAPSLPLPLCFAFALPSAYCVCLWIPAGCSLFAKAKKRSGDRTAFSPLSYSSQ